MLFGTDPSFWGPAGRLGHRTSGWKAMSGPQRPEEASGVQTLRSRGERGAGGTEVVFVLGILTAHSDRAMVSQPVEGQPSHQKHCSS